MQGFNIHVMPHSLFVLDSLKPRPVLFVAGAFSNEDEPLVGFADDAGWIRTVAIIYTMLCDADCAETGHGRALAAIDRWQESRG